MDKDSVLSLLKQKQGSRTQKEFAAMIGVSQAYLSDVYLGRRMPADKILRFLGVQKAVIYKRAK